MTFKAAGTYVIISSQTPANPFRSHTEVMPVQALYAKAIADKTGVAFVDHFSLTRDEYLGLGAAAVNEMLPSDGIHTTLVGAEVAARSFVQGVLCARHMNPLYPYVTAGARLVSLFPVMDKVNPLICPMACPGNLETARRGGLQRGFVPQPMNAQGMISLFHSSFFM